MLAQRFGFHVYWLANQLNQNDLSIVRFFSTNNSLTLMKKPLSTFSNNCNFTKNFSAILRGGGIVQFLGVHQTKLHLLYFEFWVMTLYISITYQLSHGGFWIRKWLFGRLREIFNQRGGESRLGKANEVLIVRLAWIHPPTYFPCH